MDFLNSNHFKTKKRVLFTTKCKYDSNMKNKKLTLLILYVLLISSCLKGDYRMESKKISNCWIQKTDYKSLNYEINSTNEAIDLFTNFDWISELNKYKEDDDNNNCPTGIGYHDGVKDGTEFNKLLHICPIDENYVFFNLHYPIEKKLFGIFKYRSSKIYYNEKISISYVPQLIKLFNISDFKEIIKL